MSIIKLPYGKDFMEANIPDSRLNAVLESNMHYYKPKKSQEELVVEALENPIGTPRLKDIAVGKNKIIIIASDHTRPVPSKVIMPLMLEEIRRGNPNAEITILISTGCHRGTTKEELISKFGPKIVEEENIYVHDCLDESMLVKIGTLPSGGDLIINKLAVDADLLISEGFIEPHFFAGYSGGRKSVLPGIASRTTVMYNHNAEFIASDYARAGVIEGNPLHKDMLYAARAARLDFIVNVVINAQKEVVYAVAGDVDLAHIEGRNFLNSQCKVQSVPADIAISTNGGYPLDQNIYQGVKGMTAAEATVKEGGVIIMLAKSNDGHGGEQFYKTFQETEDLSKLMEGILATPREKTIPDQWETQILVRILLKNKVIYISDTSDEMIQDMHMIPAHSIEEALEKANEILGNKDGKITVVSDGVSMIVE
ncbi:nickel-dependent lactate racemase [Alkalibaculum bacchi]|uniref:Nickel-dependent lactate racemase n=1 Tax=Alkalibaculum bacchi TaxID=645887 RepID=A0A366IC05_9FIRM|nr:nickel-dependent lactate racemase [Alkalibaculum bacchi]RBP68250.1 nickel-dependent lactate racemase [Alkalibaculum bacchi]